MLKPFLGIGVSKGVAIAKAWVLNNEIDLTPTAIAGDVKEEAAAYKATYEQVLQQMSELIGIASQNLADKIEIFEAHLEIIKDEEIQKEIKDLIKGGKSQSEAIDSIFTRYIETFVSMEDPYFQERSSDLIDIRKRFLSVALNKPLPNLLLIKEECIIVANDLTPSETALLNKKYVKGFVTNIGGSTSHSAIMARTLEIPAIVSMKDITTHIKNGEMIAMDGSAGEVVSGLEKDKGLMELWKEKEQQFYESEQELLHYLTKKCITLDDKIITLKGNIGKPEDVSKLLDVNVESVGLFRSEFLYMDSTNWPTEEEQFLSYKEVLVQIPATIRTLDIGGDKHLSYFDFPEEMNPFLGYRALRMTLDKTDIFKTQIKALLRASKYGDLKIMFPMVTTVEELKQAKKFVESVKKELIDQEISVGNFEMGMMVEIPSSALLVDKFAKYSDFFSIGSNDLIQYTNAVDRMSKEVNYLYQPNNPSILRLIKQVVDGSNGKEVSLCGEMASNPISAILLIGLGIKNLSMSASAILNIKKIICNISYKDCQTLANKAIECESELEVNNLVESFLKTQK